MFWKRKTTRPRLEKYRRILDGMARDDDDDGFSKRMVGIIDSMTLTERAEPAQITASRISRIALGAGVDSRDVVMLLRNFAICEAMDSKMKELLAMDMQQRSDAIKKMIEELPFGFQNEREPEMRRHPKRKKKRKHDDDDFDPGCPVPA